jgi:CubicO group peptidase (beta-lactamase class C family)
VKRIISVIVASALMCGASSRAGNAAEPAAAVAPTVAAKLDAAVAAGVGGAAGSAPADSVAIVEDGRIVYARAGGLEDVAAKRPATTATRFRIGSVTKMFTAVAVMQLVERGAMRLDDPIARYLPDAPHGREVTIRQLLMHSSGIPNYGDEAFNSGLVSTPTTPAAIVASMGGKPLAFTPGSRYAYSNTGYVLLGLAIESAAKMPLAAYERAHIFVPARMHDTTAGALATGPGNAIGYMDADGTPAPPYDPSWLFADGDIVSTPSDIARFDIALMNGKLLSSASFAQMRAAPIATDEEAVKYGLGVTLFPLADLSFVGHHGGLPGFEADNEMLPGQRFAVVVFGNAFSFSTAGLNGPLLATIFPASSARAVAERKAAMLVPGAGEDPAITARFFAFFSALQKGRVDRAGVTDEMNAQLTAERLPDLAQQLAPLGTLQNLIFHSKVDQGPGIVFHYTGVFSEQTTPMTFSLDRSDKIAGVFLQ